MVRDLNWYLTTARARDDRLNSDRKLGAALGVSPTMTVKYRKGHALPDERTMLELAARAGVVKAVALQDLNEWRTKNDPASAEVYARTRNALEVLRELAERPPEKPVDVLAELRKMARETLFLIALAFLIFTGTQPAQAATESATTVYYGKLKLDLFQ